LESMAIGREVSPSRRQSYIEGEVRAYTVELAAADLLSDGRFRVVVERELERCGIGGWKEVPALNVVGTCKRLAKSSIEF
jgi:hypothetical protein